MSRRTLLLLGLLAAVAAPLAARASSRPNVLVLLADDMRWDVMGHAGHPVVRTPALDRLAAEGTSFTDAFVTTSICAVSRASLLSGQFARRHGIYDFATSFTPEAWAATYPALLRAAGYHAGFIGKFGVGRKAPAEEFDFWDGFDGQGRYFEPGEDDHLTRRMGSSALRFLEEAPEGPWCLSISFKAPHAQDAAPREFPPDPQDEALYGGVEIPRPATATPEAFSRLPEFLQRSEARTRWERRFATEEMRQRTVRDYLRLITGMDREIGRILDALEKDGALDNTLIVFTSDNGFYLGEHGLAGKWFMHEESIRVPLIIRAPGPPAPRRVDALALNIDVAPTVLDFAGVAAPARMQGRSLRPWLEGRAPESWRDDFFYEHHFSFGGRIPDSEGVRTTEWKYIRYTGSEPPVESLFHLAADPGEQQDLAGDPAQADRLRELRGRWEELQKEAE